MQQLTDAVRAWLQLPAGEPLHLLVDPIRGKRHAGGPLGCHAINPWQPDRLPRSDPTLLDCYHRHRDADGFLYVVYSSQPRALLHLDAALTATAIARLAEAEQTQAQRGSWSLAIGGLGAGAATLATTLAGDSTLAGLVAAGAGAAAAAPVTAAGVAVAAVSAVAVLGGNGR